MLVLTLVRCLTNLDYYNARYYDPVAGIFMSADTRQGNLQGMRPYDYVGGNPETKNDPKGQRVACPVPNGSTCCKFESKWRQWSTRYSESY